MTYTLDASSQTGQGNALKDCWPASSTDTADGLFIQNQSPSPLDVVVTPNAVGGVSPAPKAIVFHLPSKGDWIDESKVPMDAKVQVRCPSEGASFTAIRTKS